MREPSLKRWLETGYELFAQEGPEGIQVERLARILDLNKSGFYHYFGDMETFSGELIRHHYTLFDHFLKDIERCTNVDPESVQVLLKYKVTVMAQMHLVRNKSNPLFYGAHQVLDNKVSRAMQPIWSKHLDISGNAELVSQYFSMIRDMFYSRITWSNFTFDYLRGIAREAKDIIIKIHTEKVNSVNR